MVYKNFSENNLTRFAKTIKIMAQTATVINPCPVCGHELEVTARVDYCPKCGYIEGYP